jgi:hypothetical protein
MRRKATKKEHKSCPTGQQVGLLVKPLRNKLDGTARACTQQAPASLINLLLQVQYFLKSGLKKKKKKILNGVTTSYLFNSL